MSSTENKSCIKTWILLEEDLKTPHLIDVGGQHQFESNKVMFIIVKAKTREEAKKLMRWAHESLRDATIIDPMIVEVSELKFKPARIEYDY